MIRVFLVSMLMVSFTSSLFSQDSTRSILKDYERTKETSLFLGYNYSPTDNETSNYHGLELSIYKTRFSFFRHGSTGGSLYLSQEIGMASKTLIHGTKMGANLFVMGIMLGTELTYHTDYDTQVVAVSPYLGFGAPSFRFTFAWRGKLTGYDFRQLSPLNLNLSIKAFSLKSEKQ